MTSCSPAPLIAPSSRPGVRHRARRGAVAAVTAGLALVLSGCVGTPPPLAEAWPRTLEQVRSAESVTITAELALDSGTVQLELAGRLDDSAVRAVTRRGDQRMEQLSVDGMTYTRVEGAQHPAGTRALEQVPEGRWLRTATGGAEDLSPGRVREALTAHLPRASDLAGRDVAASTVRVDGRRLHRYAQVPGLDPASVLYLDGEDRLARLELVGVDAPFTGALSFTHWDETPAPTAPPAAEVFDPAGL